jgi:hypothetical protein
MQSIMKQDAINAADNEDVEWCDLGDGWVAHREVQCPTPGGGDVVSR